MLEPGQVPVGDSLQALSLDVDNPVDPYDKFFQEDVEKLQADIIGLYYWMGEVHNESHKKEQRDKFNFTDEIKAQAKDLQDTLGTMAEDLLYIVPEILTCQIENDWV